MVGLVIVSHSRALANAVLNLTKQVSTQDLPITVAAGIGDDRSEFGTDAVEIADAIRSVYSPDGVLVMMDLGSAVLSAQMALELLEPEISGVVHLCSAPIVEGCIAAGVQIGLGSDIDTIQREAQGALLPKREQIGESTTEETVSAPAPEPTGKKITLTLHNLHGLHARPAARFVQAASSFKAEVFVTNLTNGKGPVSARSLNSIATLGAVEEHQIEIMVSGPDADPALAALKSLVDENFGESTAPQPAQPVVGAVPTENLSPLANGAFRAIPISEGIAIGPLYRYQPQIPPISQESAQNLEEEWKKFERAVEITRQAIRQRRQQIKSSVGEAEASIFDAHALILQDPTLIDQTRQAIFERRQNAAAAWHESASHVADSYRALEDAYLRQRAADILDVENQVLFALAGGISTAITFEQPVILYADDITPTETSQLDMNAVLGILTVGGGPTSHSAILARALGIPALSGVSPALERLPAGSVVAIDGFSGTIWIDPPENVQQELTARRKTWLETRQTLLNASRAPAITRDGRRVEVFANVGNLQDAQAAMNNGAEGIGLLRTEFLFLTRETPPDEAEQLTVLRQIGATMGDHPVTVRTLDVGGDKEVPYIKLPLEANPFLGVRAIRMSLRNPDLFLMQLRAILRAADDHHFRIMFPMIANVAEVRQARAYLEQAHEQLAKEGVPHAWPIETGIMVEIPSAALVSPILAREVDFFSIGTNDLTQYTLAAERGNPLLAELADAFHPAVLRLIGEVADAAHAEGKWVGICGELGGDPLAAPVLIGLGVDELSLNPGGIPKTKSIVREVNTADARKLAAQVLKTESAAEARKLAKAFLEG